MAIHLKRFNQRPVSIAGISGKLWLVLTIAMIHAASYRIRPLVCYTTLQ
jgi:hypothetical protein